MGEKKYFFPISVSAKYCLFSCGREKHVYLCFSSILLHAVCSLSNPPFPFSLPLLSIAGMTNKNLEIRRKIDFVCACAIYSIISAKEVVGWIARLLLRSNVRRSILRSFETSVQKLSEGFPWGRRLPSITNVCTYESGLITSYFQLRSLSVC